MEFSVLQGDKVFLTVFVSLLVGLVTAALSIVRLVNDKEGKTTDYRQGWCDSVRKCFADLISNINSTASLIVNHRQDVDRLDALLKKYENKNVSWPDSDVELRSLYSKNQFDSEEQIQTSRRDLYQAYALTQLHFKPSDPIFAPIEKNFDLAVEQIRTLMEMDVSSAGVDRLVVQRNKIHALAAEIAATGRGILKTEWEIVKKGERAYEITKKGSILGGGAALAILFLLGGAAMLSMSAVKAKVNSSETAHILPSGSVMSSVGTLPAPAQTNTVTQVVHVNPVTCPVAPKTAIKKPSVASPSQPQSCKN